MKYGSTLAVCLAAIGLALTTRAAAERHPNVLVVLTDEQGASDAGCLGAKDLLTPNLDALARRGVRLTQFEAASSQSSASLAGLLTGRYPAPTVEAVDAIRPKTMEDSFRAAGYATGHANGEAAAERLLDSKRSQPFLFYVEIGKPGQPLQPGDTWTDRFKALPPPRDRYAALIATIDERLGRLLKKVDDLGLRENTIVVFQSLRGHPTEERPLSADSAIKGSFFEESIRVPAIIAWPGHLPEGAERGQLAHGFDWLPTLADLCRVNLLDWDIDGCSLVSVLQSADAPTPHAILHWQLRDGPAPQYAVRENNWKLMATAADITTGPPKPPQPPFWLSDPVADPSESKNLAAQNPSAVSRLRSLQGYWKFSPALYHSRNIPAAKLEPIAAAEVTTLPPITTGQRVFTCGHSFHAWVAPILLDLANKAGIEGHEIAGVSSIGASRIIEHWDVPEAKNKAKAALRSGKVDVLTLSPIWLPDDGIEKFARLGLEHNPNLRIAVQELWVPTDTYNPVYPLETSKYVDHNAATGPELRKQNDLYRKGLEDYVRDLNTRLGKNAVLVVPVGEAVVALREKIIAHDPAIDPALRVQWCLFIDSWGHPTAPLRALEAYCNFAVIYRRSPVGLPMPLDLASNRDYARPALNLLLQKLAWDAVIHNPLSGVTQNGEIQR